MKRPGTILYIVFNFIIGFSFSYGQLGDVFVHRKSVVWVMLLLLYVFLPVGTIIGGMRFTVKRMPGKYRFYKYLVKSILVILTWPIMAVYFLIRSWWDGVGNRELIDLYGNWLLYLEINTYQLLVFWTNSMLLYNKNIISHAYMNHMRVKEYLKWEISVGISFMIMVAIFVNPQYYSEETRMYNIREHFLIYPCIILIWMYIQNEVTKYCIWNYDWERMYEKELLEKGIAPNIETVPFPD